MKNLFILIASTILMFSCGNNKSTSVQEAPKDSVTLMKYAFAEAYVDSFSFVGAVYEEPSSIEFSDWNPPVVNEIKEFGNYKDPVLLDYLNKNIELYEEAKLVADSAYLVNLKGKSNSGFNRMYVTYKNGKIQIIEGWVILSSEYKDNLSQLKEARDKVQENIQGE